MEGLRLRPGSAGGGAWCACGQEKHREMEGVFLGCRRPGLMGCGEAERRLGVLDLCFWLPPVRYPHLASGSGLHRDAAKVLVPAS